MKPIGVTYQVYSTPWAIQNKLHDLLDSPILSFDVETKGLYSKLQRKEAMNLIEQDLSIDNHRMLSVIANNSGLSFPSLVETTHFIFGFNKSCSVVLVPENAHIELLIWNWLKTYPGKLLIHNTLFDLKLMYHRTRSLPIDYEDTALMLKTLINNSDSWKAKVGLKEQMGSYYAPSWAMYDEYEPEDNKNPKFLEYAAIDGAATFYLYELMMETVYG